MVDRNWNSPRRCPGPKLPAASAERAQGRRPGQVAAADVHVVHAERRSAGRRVRWASRGLGQRQRDPGQLQPPEAESGAHGEQRR